MNREQIEHLMQHAHEDETYRETLMICKAFEPEYKRILDTLSPEDRHCLKIYLRVRVGAEECLTRTAYFLTPKE